MVTRASAVTISRAAEFLSKDQRTIAFALAEMEYLRELLAEHKRNIPAVLSGWLRRCQRPTKPLPCFWVFMSEMPTGSYQPKPAQTLNGKE
jgi:hypothetical protein